MEIHDKKTRALLSQGRIEEAIDRLESDDLEEDTSLPPPSLRAGALLAEIGRYDRAEVHLRQALKVDNPQVRAMARAYQALHTIHATGDMVAVQTLLARAFEEAGTGAALGLALHVRAIASLKTGSLGKAVEDLLQAGKIYQTHKDEPGRARILDSLGQCFELKGRPERAVAFYARSIVKKAVVGDRPGLAITLGNLGRLNLRMGYLDDALECFEEDLALSREVGDLRGEVRMQADIARTLIAAGRQDEADSALDRALSAALTHGGPRDVMLVRKDRAEWHLLRSDPEAALKEVELGEKILNTNERVPQVMKAIFQAVKGKALMAAGEKTRGIQLLRKAVVVFSQRAVRGLYVEVLRDLARAYGNAGMKANALRCCHQALKTGRRMGFPRLVHLLEADLRNIESMKGIVEEKVTLLKKGVGPGALSGYEVISLLGRGGFGTVYKALDLLGDRVVAVKVLDLGELPDIRDRDWRVALFLREAEMASRVDYPAVAGIHAQGRDEEGNLHLVMDFVEGIPLDTRLKKGRLDLPGLLQLAHGVTGALQAIHQAGILHRDLKPANVILKPDGDPVVVDFGIALLFGKRGKAGSSVFSGTLHYAAPEQLAGRRMTAATDLYAFGVMLYEAASGQLPIEVEGENIHAWRRAKQAGGHTPLHSITPGLPRSFSSLVDRLLAPRPGKRPQTADAVMTVLTGLS